MTEHSSRKKLAVVAGVVFAIAYGSLFLHAHLDDALATQIHMYAKAVGTVTHSTVTYVDQAEHFNFVVTFSVNDKTYNATPGIFGVIGDDSMRPEQLATAYPVDAPYPVWYLPGDPSNSYLKLPETNRNEHIRGFACITFILLLTVLMMLRSSFIKKPPA